MRKLAPCDCPKGGMYSDGTLCQKCGGTEWRAATRVNADKLSTAAIVAMPDSDLLDLQAALGSEMGRLTQVTQTLRSNLARIKNELRLRREGGRTRGEPIISDHAVVRYLERHKGMDIAAVRDELREIAMRSKRDGMEKRKAERLHDEASNVTMVYSADRNAVSTVLSPEAQKALDA